MRRGARLLSQSCTAGSGVMEFHKIQYAEVGVQRDQGDAKKGS